MGNDFVFDEFYPWLGWEDNNQSYCKCDVVNQCNRVALRHWRQSHNKLVSALCSSQTNCDRILAMTKIILTTRRTLYLFSSRTNSEKQSSIFRFVRSQTQPRRNISWICCVTFRDVARLNTVKLMTTFRNQYSKASSFDLESRKPHRQITRQRNTKIKSKSWSRR